MLLGIVPASRAYFIFVSLQRISSSACLGVAGQKKMQPRNIWKVSRGLEWVYNRDQLVS